jgi:hypothetical protein
VASKRAGRVEINAAEAKSLIAKARELYEDSDDCDLEIDDGARFSPSDGGCWVSAWVWVPKED